MAKELCVFCGCEATGSYGVPCCRKCAYKDVPRLVARSFIGTAQAKDMQPLLDSLLRDFQASFWDEFAIIVGEQQPVQSKGA